MGLFSKIFENADKEAAPILNKLKNLAENVVSEASRVESLQKEARKPQSGRPSRGGLETGSTVPVFEPESAPSGVSWGPVMPAEENQFNFRGSYVQYFDQIFGTEFAEYRIDREMVRDEKAAVYTFWTGEQKALVVEVMSDRSSAAKLRETCRFQGIPYLRYYYDHKGWWNTRSYVVQRTAAALGR